MGSRRVFELGLKVVASAAAFLMVAPNLASASSLTVIDNASSITHINNTAIRFGTDQAASINNRGLLLQPWYYSKSASQWYKLTFSSLPLDMAFGFGTSTTHWTKNTIYDLSSNSTPIPDLTVDYSGLNQTAGGGNRGWGTALATALYNLGGSNIEIKNSYSLGESDDFVRIETQVTNRSNATIASSNIWVGTRDDWIGASTDNPTKVRGNIDADGFTQIPTAASPSNAIRVTSGSEGVLFYTVTPGANSIIQSCCSFSNATGQNPTTSQITNSNDGSYGMYFPVGDLAPQQSVTVVWFYAAGSIQDLANAARAVAAAGAAEQTLDALTTEGGTLGYEFNYPGTTHFVVVDRGAATPSAVEVSAGIDYGAVKVRAAGTGALSGSGTSFTRDFVITGLSPSTQYTVYTVTTYDDPDNPGTEIYSDVTPVNFSTLALAPTVGSITPSNQQVSFELTSATGITNYQYSIDGGSNWVSRSPASVSSPWVIAGLTNGTSYDFRFRSIFDGQPGVSTGPITVTAGAVASAPRSLGMTLIAGGGASIRWAAPSSDGGNALSGYLVEYRVSDDWVPITPDGTTAQVPAVTVSQAWSFRVAAVNTIGTGAFSTFTHNPPAPTTVTPSGPATLVSPQNQPTVTAPPGQSVVGSVSGGVVTPGTATVSRITADDPAVIKSEAQALVAAFNDKWGGSGELTAPPITVVDTPTGALLFGLLTSQTDSTPIGIPAENVVLVESDNQAVILAASTRDEPARVDPSGALIVNGGSVLGVAAHGFEPNVRGELILLSTPTLLGDFSTDADGTFIGQATIPTQFEAGAHTAVLITDGLVASMGILVERQASSGAVYTGPLITGFSSRVIPSGLEASITVRGSRLEGVAAVALGQTAVSFVKDDRGDLVLTVPAMEPGIYDLILVSSSGRVTYQQAIRVYDSGGDEMRKPARLWTRFNADSNSVRLYARDIVGVGHVQFFVNGVEVYGISALDNSEPGLNLGIAGVLDGLVLDVGVDSLNDGRNIFEIFVDGGPVVRRVFNR